MNNILETVRNFISNIFDKANNMVEPYVAPIIKFLSNAEYIVVALILLGLILLVIPGLFAYLKKATKLFVFLLIVFGIIFLLKGLI